MSMFNLVVHDKFTQYMGVADFVCLLVFSEQQKLPFLTYLTDGVVSIAGNILDTVDQSFIITTQE